MLHAKIKLGDRHAIVDMVFVDATAKAAYVPDPTDTSLLYKVAYQESTTSFFALTSLSPIVWTALGGPPPAVTAASVSILDVAGYYSAVNVETALAETAVLHNDIIASQLALPYFKDVAVSDEVTALALTNKITFHWNGAMQVNTIWIGLTTPQATGTVLTVDIKQNGASIFTTLLTIDNTEATSLTAVTPYVTAFNPTNFVNGDKVEILITQVGDGTAKGLKAYFKGIKYGL